MKNKQKKPINNNPITLPNNNNNNKFLKMNRMIIHILKLLAIKKVTQKTVHF